MATLLIRNGAPTRLVQLLGGWSDVRMVERYTRVLRPADVAPFAFSAGLAERAAAARGER